MKPPLPFLLLAGLLLFGPLSSCEKPQVRETPAPEEPAAPATAVNEAPAANPVAPAPPASAAGSSTPAEASPESDLPEAEPELLVAQVGKKILLSGALKSRIQVERIAETLAREFPDHELVNELKLEYHRIPVGWGNRVAESFLVPFFERVPDGRVSYRDAIVTLEGTVSSDRELRMITEVAIETFSGGSTEDVENKLKVAEPPKP